MTGFAFLSIGYASGLILMKALNSRRVLGPSSNTRLCLCRITVTSGSVTSPAALTWSISFQFSLSVLCLTAYVYSGLQCSHQPHSIITIWYCVFIILIWACPSLLFDIMGLMQCVLIPTHACNMSHFCAMLTAASVAGLTWLLLLVIHAALLPGCPVAVTCVTVSRQLFQSY